MPPKYPLPSSYGGRSKHRNIWHRGGRRRRSKSEGEGDSLFHGIDSFPSLFPPYCSFLIPSPPGFVCTRIQSVASAAKATTYRKGGGKYIFFRPDHDFAGSDYLCCARHICASLFAPSRGVIRAFWTKKPKKNEAFQFTFL